MLFFFFFLVLGFLFLDIFILCCMGVLSVFVSMHHVCPDAQKGQERALDFLGLEFQKVVSSHVGARN